MVCSARSHVGIQGGTGSDDLALRFHGGGADGEGEGHSEHEGEAGAIGEARSLEGKAARDELARS